MEGHHAETGETKEPTSMGGGTYARPSPTQLPLALPGQATAPDMSTTSDSNRPPLQDEPHLCSLAVASGRCCEDGVALRVSPSCEQEGLKVAREVGYGLVSLGIGFRPGRRRGQWTSPGMSKLIAGSFDGGSG